MTGFAFRKNATFEWQGEQFRVREITASGEVLLEALSRGALALVQQQDLLAAYAAGRLRAAQPSAEQRSDPLIYSRPLSALKPGLQAQAMRRQRYLRAICADGDPVWSEHFMRPLIEKVASELQDANPPSLATLRRWLRAANKTV